MDIEQLKTEIVTRLKPLNPYKIILFGSYAYGNPTEDSDIDLYEQPMMILCRKATRKIWMFI